MKIVAITDIHGRHERTKKLAEVVREEFDLILIAGDLTNFQGREKAREVLNPILSLQKPIFAVFGNCDGRDVPEFLREKGVLIHDRRVEFNGVGIIGVGGSNRTPFGTIWEFGEDEIRSVLEKNYRDGDIILSHMPPYKTKADRVHFGMHVGSRALRAFIEDEQPPLVICGHIHEARSVDNVGKTIIINPGPLFRGYYAVVEIGEKISVKLERL
ncbi:metallophosphoesterase [Thermococcus sp.]